LSHSAQGIVICEGYGSVGGGYLGGLAPHGGVFAGICVGSRVAVGHGVARSIRGGEYPVAAFVGCAGLDVFPVHIVAQHGLGHIADSVIGHRLGHGIIGDGQQPVLIGGIIGIIEGTVAAGDLLDEVIVGIVLGSFVCQICGSYRYQVALVVILHSLSLFPDQGDVVEMGGVDVVFVQALDLDGFHGLFRLFRDHGHAAELPGLNIRAEGQEVLLGLAVAVGDLRHQAAILCDIVGHLGGIGGRIRLDPAGENIGFRAGKLHIHGLVNNNH